jgi:hypothetical protein
LKPVEPEKKRLRYRIHLPLGWLQHMGESAKVNGKGRPGLR